MRIVKKAIYIYIYMYCIKYNFNIFQLSFQCIVDITSTYVSYHFCHIVYASDHFNICFAIVSICAKAISIYFKAVITPSKHIFISSRRGPYSLTRFNISAPQRYLEVIAFQRPRQGWSGFARPGPPASATPFGDPSTFSISFVVEFRIICISFVYHLQFIYY